MVGRLLVFCLGLTIVLMANPGQTIAQDATIKPDVPAAADSEQETVQEVAVKREISSEYLLPATTKAWFSIPDYSQLKEDFGSTMLGQLAKDEKLKPFIDSLGEQFRDWLNNQNVRLGMDIEDVQSVRTGEICIAGVLRDRAGEQDEQLGTRFAWSCAPGGCYEVRR